MTHEQQPVDSATSDFIPSTITEEMISQCAEDTEQASSGENTRELGESITLNLSTDEVSSATIGPSKSTPEEGQANSMIDDDIDTTVTPSVDQGVESSCPLTENGVEIMRKQLNSRRIIFRDIKAIKGQHHSFETLNDTDQIDTMMTGLTLMNQSILITKQVLVILKNGFSSLKLSRNQLTIRPSPILTSTTMTPPSPHQSCQSISSTKNHPSRTYYRKCQPVR